MFNFKILKNFKFRSKKKTSMNKDEQDCLMTDMPTNDTETSAGKTNLLFWKNFTERYHL